jgi:hypothetical protein
VIVAYLSRVDYYSREVGRDQALLIEKGKRMPKLEDYELEEQYKEMLDEVYGMVKVAGYKYETSRALYELDPVAYRVGFNDWLDSLDNCEDCDKNPIECECEA